MARPNISNELRALAARLETENTPGGVLCIQAASEIDNHAAILNEIANGDFRGPHLRRAITAFKALNG